MKAIVYFMEAELVRVHSGRGRERKAAGGVTGEHHVLTVAEVATSIAPDTSPKLTAVAHFKAGQRVRARNMHPIGHTRLPRYVRAKVGTIERAADVEKLPDSDIEGLGAKQQHVYTVRFAARELWGERASRHDSVYMAMWEGYLESA